ncbi:MAG: hypothetical protein ACRCXT_05475 [Paraclostridium sp.]
MKLIKQQIIDNDELLNALLENKQEINYMNIQEFKMWLKNNNYHQFNNYQGAKILS